MATGEEQSSIRWSRGFFLEAVGLNERRGLSWDFNIVNCAELSGLSSSTTIHISRGRKVWADRCYYNKKTGAYMAMAARGRCLSRLACA